MSVRFMRNTDAALLCAYLAMAVFPAMGQPSPPYAGSEACGTCHGHREGLREEPAPSGGYRQSGVGTGDLRVLPWPRPETRRSGRRSLNPQSGETRGRGYRSHLSHLSPESADPHWPTAEQPCQKTRSPATCHKVRRRAGRIGSAQGRCANEECASCHTNVWAQFSAPIIWATRGAMAA
jgi:hypothetical protein